MQAGPHLVGRVGVTPPLIAHNQRSTGGNADQTRHPEPLPHVAHGFSLHIVQWWTPVP